MKTCYWSVLLILALGCGRFSHNPYDGAQAWPQGATHICTNLVLGDESITTFAGVVYCDGGQVFFSNDRYTPLSALPAGTYTKEQAGLLCGFTVDTSCNLSAITF